MLPDHEADRHGICFGSNHGTDLQRAVAYTQTHADAWVEHAHGGVWRFERAELGATVFQPASFDAPPLP
ncbi:hypothetical protein [Nonomuraea turcica]|uniref:hypothetical protein n=1 Tax=Nonomuraea sp. G32 TaxID=3067274 RepID=UPI00273BF9E6|nr:hypothetical protein [Nonomuraea sp. G32]MDP4511177.1 hypothetical protein [Nonomuraea sp. G32]